MAPTVLVVDDTDPVLALVSRQLKDGGYEVLEAGSATEALVILAAPEVQVDLVLTDLKMPDLEGQQLAEAITDLPVSPPILYMSAYPAPEGLEDRFLQKPFTHKELLTAVREALAADPDSQGQ